MLQRNRCYAPDPLHEKLIRKNFNRYVRFVARAYNARPNLEQTPLRIKSYRSLLDHTLKFYNKLASRLDVIFVDGDPYKNAAEMTQDIKQNKRMLVSKEFSENLLSGWTPKENWIFRAVHDYVIHYGGKHNFSMRGELGAYNRHAKLLPAIARPALFSEVVAQAAYYIVTGGFPDIQKAALLYGFDYDSVGKIDVKEYKKNFDPKYGGDPMSSLPKLESTRGSLRLLEHSELH